MFCGRRQFAVSVGLPEQLLLDPVFVLRDFDVHPRNVSLPTPDAPGDDSGQLPEAGPGLLAPLTFGEISRSVKIVTLQYLGVLDPSTPTLGIFRFSLLVQTQRQYF